MIVYSYKINRFRLVFVLVTASFLYVPQWLKRTTDIWEVVDSESCRGPRLFLLLAQMTNEHFIFIYIILYLTLFFFRSKNSSNTREGYLLTSRGNHHQLEPCLCVTSGTKCHQMSVTRFRTTSLKN